MLDKLKGTTNSLQKATIVVVKTKESIPCQFNPQELSISRSVRWQDLSTPFLNSPLKRFSGIPATTCAIKLTFDTSETGGDVRAYTNQLMRLTMKGGGNAKASDIFLPPPTVAFVWGKFTLFKAVITQLTISYVLFLPDGTPVRARANMTFSQNDHDDDGLPGQNPTTRTNPRKTRLVQVGERLDYIAFEEYGHPRHWRTLAEANGIDHVEQLTVGQTLIIPPLD